MADLPPDIAARVPNTAQIQKLQDERIQLLQDKRAWEIRRDEAITNHEIAAQRLKIVESALEGIGIGVGHAKEVAANASGAQEAL